MYLNKSENTIESNNYKGFLIDLIIYISVMFLIREVYFESIGFLANGIFWSLTTLIVAIWRMKVRRVTWPELGLKRPNSALKTLGVSLLIFIGIIVSIFAFEMVKGYLPITLAADTSVESATSKFGNLKDNWNLFFSIMPIVLLESFLEEILDRGFLLNWFERMFSMTSYATVLAVLFQACIFGFRHSNDLSERSITAGLIGLVMGIAYVKFGRNLWPLIIAHCVLNTFSMLERV